MILADVYLGHDINSLNPIHSWIPLLTPNPIGSTLLFLQLQSSVTGQWGKLKIISYLELKALQLKQWSLPAKIVNYNIKIERDHYPQFGMKAEEWNVAFNKW